MIDLKEAQAGLKEAEEIFGIKQRTLLQNSALHLYYDHLAKTLTEAGHSLNRAIEILPAYTPVTAISAKESIWRPQQIAMFNKVSTTELTTGEITQIWEVLNLAYSTEMGIHVPFPSIEQTQAYLESLKKSFKQ